MATTPNKLTQFWQELKRRNVTRVLAVYIASAFMILCLIASGMNQYFNSLSGNWKSNTRQSMKGLGSGWWRMICFDNYKSIRQLTWCHTPYCLSRLLKIRSHEVVIIPDGQKIAPVVQRIH